MAERENENNNSVEKINAEIQLIRNEDLFCRKCSIYFRTKTEFDQHLQEHLEEANIGTTNFMCYIEKFICSDCGKTFELKSDLIIHHNTVCLNAPYTCKHCKENCGNLPFLQMHLWFHHNYSEERFRDEEFLTNIDDNPAVSTVSFAENFKNFSKISFKYPSEESKDLFKAGSSKSPQPSCSNSKLQRPEGKRQDLAFNMLDKVHTCEICNESFSRKCVLDIHAQKHFLHQREEKQLVRRLSAKSSTMKSLENLAISTMQGIANAGTSGGTTKHSDYPRAILQPSNVVSGSSIWEKIHPRTGLQDAKSFSSKNAIKKSKNANISGVTSQHASRPRSALQPSNVVPDSSMWKNIKLRSRVKDVKISDKVVTKKSNKKCHKKSKLGETKGLKIKPKSEEEKQIFTCKLCKRKFKDGYKLRRHHFIHTGERPYSCTKCKKSFARDDHLKRHVIKVCSKTDDAK